MPDALSPSRLAALDAFLLELNKASADEILPLFRADHGLEDKGGARGFDPVTLADKNAEAAIRRRIAATFPDHGVIGEEYGSDRPDAEFVWIIDPVDGTRAFIAGLPVWTTLIGLRHLGGSVLGSIGQPYLNEVFIGHAGGARLISHNGDTPLKIQPCAALNQALIATTDPALFDEREASAWSTLRASTRLARLGCDAYAYAMVAMGRIDVVVETGLKSWDIEAARAVIAGAGGGVFDWAGAPIGDNGGQMLIVGDLALRDRVADLLRPAARP
jgi:histidinol phosphatase-like enzyme (inositol monophosphatase family)